VATNLTVTNGFSLSRNDATLGVVMNQASFVEYIYGSGFYGRSSFGEEVLRLTRVDTNNTPLSIWHRKGQPTSIVNWPVTSFILGCLDADTGICRGCDFGVWGRMGVTGDATVSSNLTVNGRLTTAQLTLNGASTTPTNGAILTCTNDAGQAGWTLLPKITVYASSSQEVAVGSFSPILFPSVSDKTANGTWDGTNWAPGVTGWLTLHAQGYSQGAETKTICLYENEIQADMGNCPNQNFWFYSCLWYSSVSTNRFSIRIQPTTAMTNQAGTTPKTFFSGAVLP
jgi:hypothetical protein